MAKPASMDASASDESLVQSVRRGEVSRFSELIQRHNGSLYRVARSIVRDDHEAEDVVQQAHVAAFMHLHEFEGRAKYSTWLARIAAHEAFARLRHRRRVRALADDGARTPSAPPSDTPEEVLSRNELARAVESAIDELPHPYRSAFVLRHVEGLDTSEAAAWLGVSEANLRVLLHRARALLKDRILEQARITADEVFSFGGARCARTTARVLATLAEQRPSAAAQVFEPAR
jgi:RNA polymerase sigma-70 factor (ECF subfamily)